MAAEPDRLRWARLGSIRFRLTALAVALVLGSLLVASTALVANQRSRLTDTIDDALRVRGDALEAVLDADALPGVISNRGDADAIVQVVDVDGTVLATTDNIAGEAALAEPTFTGERFVTVEDTPIDEATFRVLIRPITTNEGPVGLLVAARFDSVSDSIRSLSAALAVAVPALALVVAGISWLLVGRALRPVDKIRAEVDTIAAADLHRRVSTGAANDELGRLASTMNLMLERIESGHQRQQQFVADASHELRSPLTRMRGHLEVDLRTDAEPEQLLATHQRVLQDIDHLQHLVTDLLELARHDEHRVPSRQNPVDLDDLVHDQTRHLRDHERITLDLSGVSPVQVTGDHRQLARALRNLIDNAERHADRSISIDVHETDGSAHVRVTDDGPGIPPSDRERIFERFVRADQARTSSSTSASTGLGLAITKAITERHHGTIELDPSYTNGARFVITFPGL
jgi:signal transduction histidine kinase